MSAGCDLTVAEAITEHRKVHNRNPLGDVDATWVCQMGPIHLRFPNFQWRREAVLWHDLHHILNDYPCTMRGECQTAAWEFAAGWYANYWATLFCLPLIMLGIILVPVKTFRAFVRGRHSTSLFGVSVGSQLSMNQLRSSTLPDYHPQPRLSDWVAFALLAIRSLSVIALPCAVILAAIALFRL